MVNYTKPELEITEFEIVDVLTISIQNDGSDPVYGDWYWLRSRELTNPFIKTCYIRVAGFGFLLPKAPPFILL